MTPPDLRHLDRAPFDEATRARVWSHIDRARLEAALPKRPMRGLRPLALAFAVGGGLCMALLLGPSSSSRIAPSFALGRRGSVHESIERLAVAPASSSQTSPPEAHPIPSSAPQPIDAAPATPVFDKLHVDDRAARKVAGYVEAGVPSIEELFAAADRARTASRPAEAALLFEQIARTHPADPRAALAMLTAARIHLDTLHRPADAARCFERALALGLPSALAEDARARALEARSLAGP